VASLRTIWVLAAQNLRGRYRSLIIWGVALGALGALYVALYPTMSNILQDYIDQAPEQMQQFMGGLQGTITIQQWLEMELFSAIMPIALPFLVIVLGARTIAGSEERKTLDLLLSNPLPRWQVVAGALTTMALSLAGVLALTCILTYAAVPFADVDLGLDELATTMVSLWPFCLLFGAFSLLISSVVRRNVFAVIIPAVVLIATYVINSLSQATESMRPLRFISLLYYLGHPLQGDFPWTAVLGMLAAVCVLSALAVVSFNRRDIYT
jgi:ABC-2 type transport system permease protein